MERAFKYHGLGNDFVVLDRRASAQDIDPETSRRLCDRRRGIGADGVLVVLPSREAVAKMVVHNADGSIAEMCGNGIRCVVKHLAESGADRPESVRVETGAGILSCRVHYAERRVSEVEVQMGPARILFEQTVLPDADGVRGIGISMGNPHLVLFDRSSDEAARLGPVLERHPLFPDRTNVEWVQREGEGFRVVVWERGVGFTQACGTGACASVAAAAKLGRAPFGAWVPVELPGGRLRIRVASDLSRVEMAGPATFVFEASLP